MLDVFASSVFTLRELTAAVNNLPHVPSRLGSMPLAGSENSVLFLSKPITTTKAQIEARDGVLYLVPALPRGAPPTANIAEGRKMYPLTCTHLPVVDRVHADEVQDVRAFGLDQAQTIQTVVNDRLATMQRSIEATWEHLRVGAIKGEVRDADGVTVLYDLFDVFGVTKETVVAFDLSNGSPAPGAVKEKCSAVIRTIEDNLGGNGIDVQVTAECGPLFMDKLTSHPETTAAYARWQNGQALRDRIARRNFLYAGILFEEYRGKVGGLNFIGADEAHFFPTSVPELFQMVFAPGNFVDTVNTLAMPMYGSPVVDPQRRWIDIYVQSNPLAYCTRPRVLMQGIAGA